MNEKLEFMPRAVEYNAYDFINPDDPEDLNTKTFEIETNTRHQLGEIIYFRNEEDINGIFIVEEVSHELYKQRLSETVVNWKFIHHYALRKK